MKKVPVLVILVFSLLLATGNARARGGHGGGGHGGGGHGFHGGAFHGGGFHGGRAFASRGVYGWPHYGYYGGYPYYSGWVPGYWAEECTTGYCERVWVPGYWRRW
jgi:hypothetical protein